MLIYCSYCCCDNPPLAQRLRGSSSGIILKKWNSSFQSILSQTWASFPVSWLKEVWSWWYGPAAMETGVPLHLNGLFFAQAPPLNYSLRLWQTNRLRHISGTLLVWNQLVTGWRARRPVRPLQQVWVQTVTGTQINVNVLFIEWLMAQTALQGNLLQD